MKNDFEIQQDVLAELGRDQTLAVGAIGVEVHHGVVKLAGSVRDESTKERSEVAARRVDGVTSVIMDIDVDGAGAGAASRTAGSISREARVI